MYSNDEEIYGILLISIVSEFKLQIKIILQLFFYYFYSAPRSLLKIAEKKKKQKITNKSN